MSGRGGRGGRGWEGRGGREGREKVTDRQRGWGGGGREGQLERVGGSPFGKNGWKWYLTENGRS